MNTSRLVPRRMRVSLLAIVVLLQASLVLAADVIAETGVKSTDQAPAFDVISFQCPGVILLAASGDANGDGLADLFLFHKPSKEAYEKWCSVYFQDENGFASEPSTKIFLGETVGAIEIEDIDANGADEICAFGATGMAVFDASAASNAEPQLPLQYPTLLPAVSRRMVEVDWIADIGSDERLDVVLPTAGGIRILSRGSSDAFELSRTLDVPIKGSVSGDGGQHHITQRLPAIAFADFDHDGHTDLGAFDLEEMNFFLTDGSQTIGRRVTSPLLREFTKDFVAATNFRDLNADGVPDAVLALMSQKKNLESEVRIYFGNSDLTYSSKPAHVYSGSASLILPMFLDATGDGKLEMLLQNIDVGIGFFINYFLADRIRVDTELRRIGPEGRYEEEIALRRAIYVRASATGTEPARGIGDFNGDGLEDLAVGTAEERLSFFLSDKESIVPSRPSFDLPVPAYGTMNILELNADGRADILIRYPQDEQAGTATLLLSR